jgi:hypothetical protein
MGHPRARSILNISIPHAAARTLVVAQLVGCWLVGSITGAGAQTIVLEPVGPPQSLPIGPDGNRPPITFLSDPEQRPLPGQLTSWKSMRDAGVVRQALDYSCGSAALATLLAASGDPATEPEILRAVFEGLDEAGKSATIAEGLSLLDLQRVATLRGHRAEGYRVGPEILAKINRPVIVYIEPYGYRHFAVMRGIKGDRVFLADPARGNVRMPIWRFLDMWQDANGEGVVFLVGLRGESSLVLSADADPQPELFGVRQQLPLAGPGFQRIDAPTRLLIE